jgi:hypothetical protein
MPNPRTVQEVVTSICAIPDDFHRRGDVSVVRLLEESGYATFRDAVVIAEIRQHLEAHPDLISSWAGYSEDKRCSSGWYFDDSRYSTGHFSSDAGRSRELVFGERSQACAEFIKHEIDSILENAT